MARFVFGMGVALINHWKYIKRFFDPEYVLDNDRNKWGTVEPHTNLPCLSPEQLQKFEQPEILITVGDPYIAEQIKDQLKKADIEGKILTDELEKWTKGAPLPEHLEAMSKLRKKILLFNTPEHDNVGDHLITLSEMDFLNERFSDYEIYEITDIEYTWHHSAIKERVGEDDIILITGGGFLGSLWLYNGENNVRSILQEYPCNKVIILPQTIYFEENERGKTELKKTTDIYSHHKNFTICAREQMSYHFLQSVLPGSVKMLQLPDAALYYKTYNIPEKEETRNALVCLRRDKEQIISEQTRKLIYDKLEKNGWGITETSMHSGNFDGIAGRRDQVEAKLNEIGQAGVVVTDTLHCMVSAAITGTPCIAFDNLSGKVQGVYEWIENLPYIRICKDASGFEEVLQKVCRAAPQKINLESYEDQLENVIRGRQ